MSPAGLPRRGVANLHTLGAQSGKHVPPYKAYLRVSFLEVERARYGLEIVTARARLERLLARCRDIETEKVALLTAADQPTVATIATPAAVRTLRSGRRQFSVSY